MATTHDTDDGHVGSWEQRSRIVLTPVAAPSILGLYGFAAATFIVASHMAGWYGDGNSALYLFPFAAVFGGLAQFVAGVVSYRARDGLATAMHGMWGSFWMAYGILYLLFALKVLTEPTGAFPELGFWFITLAAITWVGTVAASAESAGLMTVLGVLATGATLAAIAFLTDTSWVETAAGWVLVASAVAAFYVASALMLEGSFGKVVLPLGKYSKESNTPGSMLTYPIENPSGMPGVKVGQ